MTVVVETVVVVVVVVVQDVYNTKANAMGAFVVHVSALLRTCGRGILDGVDIVRAEKQQTLPVQPRIVDS